MRSVESHILEDLNKKALCMIDRVPLLHGIFEGRDDLLDQIHQTFSGGDRVLFLEGIGGIGKSELAKAVAYRGKSSDTQDWLIRIPVRSGWMTAGHAFRRVTVCFLLFPQKK